ncbi:MAG: gliding motility-associated C-terminal domain-containing protein [Lewinellaceae bacterium]|nr:gliding motility-associated C-terminal domain-containing protein [Lewinellaceae bacterium]
MKYGLFSAFWLLLCAVSTASGQGIQLTFDITEPTCNGYTDGTATVNPSGGATPYTYMWDNGQNGQTNFGLGAGTYFVTVNDNNGQVVTGSVTVTQPDPLLVNVSAVGLSCSSANGTLTANVTGGTQPYEYEWSTAETTPEIDVSMSGGYLVTVTDANGCSSIGTFNVPTVAEFLPSYIFTRPACNGEATGGIAVTVFGTYPPFTWEWSNGVVNQNLTNVAAGDYEISITDMNGCTFVDQVTLLDNPQLIVEVIVTNVACASNPEDGTVFAAVAGGVSPYTYMWDNNSTLPGQEELPPGTYTVTVTDFNGCTAVASGTITMPPPLDGELVAMSPACGGNNGCVTVSGVGGTPPYTYNWPVLGVSGPTVCDLAPGDYYVCIFDANGCQHDMTVTVDSISGLDVSLIITKAECPGVDNGTATAVVTPATTIYNYEWIPQPNPNVSQINSIPAGTVVSVTVTDPNNGCMGTATAVVGAHNQVEVDVTDTDVNCFGDSTGTAIAVASHGTDPYEYVWTMPDNSMVNGPSLSNLAPGAYAVVVTDMKGCTAIGVADIGVLSDPMANISMNVLECLGDSLTVQFEDASTDQYGTITGWDWNIVWATGSMQSNDQNPPIIVFTENQTGTVTLTVTTSAGCSSTFTGPFEIKSIPDVSVSVPTPVFDCDNEPIDIVVTGDPDNTYTWMPQTGLTFNPDALNVIADPDETTDYQLIVSNGQCADTTDIKVIRVDSIQLMVQGDSIVTCDTIATLTATANANISVDFEWTNSNSDVVGMTSSINVTAMGASIYTVVATDIYGCTETDDVKLIGNSVDVDVSFGGTLSGCENLPLDLSVENLDPVDILTYNWASSSPDLVITPQGAAQVTATGPAGSYTVTVTVSNQFDCTREFVVQVELDSTMSLDGLISANLCNGLTVDFTNSSGINGTWDFGDNTTSNLSNPTHTYATDGMYMVTFNSTEACVYPFDSTIAVLPDAAVMAAIGNDYVACSEQAEIQFTDQTDHVYPLDKWNWTFSSGQGSTDQNPLITFSTEEVITATLIVTDINGCADTTVTDVQIAIVQDTLGSAAILCPGDTVSLNPDFDDNYDYVWTSQPLDPNFVDTLSPNPSVIPFVPTVYTVTIVNGPCMVTDSVEVTPQPAALVDLPSDTLVCSDASFTIKINSSNGVSYTWADNPAFNPVLPDTDDSLIVTPEKNGRYYVRVQNAAGCTAVDSILVNNAEVNIQGDPADDDICLGGSSELNITNSDPEDMLTYEWSPALDPIPNPVVSPTESTTYTVEVINQFGCKDTLAFNVNVISIDVTAEVLGKDTICPGQSTDLLATVVSNSNDITYEWTPSFSLSGSDTANPTASPDEDTQYIVTAIAGGLCPDTATVTVYFMTGECVEPFIFVPKAFTPNHDGNNEFFIVRGVNITELYFVVWDRWGEKVYETEDPKAQGWDGTYNGKELTPDSYAWYVRVTCGNGEIYINKGDVTLLK